MTSFSLSLSLSLCLLASSKITSLSSFNIPNITKIQNVAQHDENICTQTHTLSWCVDEWIDCSVLFISPHGQRRRCRANIAHHVCTCVRPTCHSNQLSIELHLKMEKLGTNSPKWLDWIECKYIHRWCIAWFEYLAPSHPLPKHVTHDWPSSSRNNRNKAWSSLPSDHH